MRIRGLLVVVVGLAMSTVVAPTQAKPEPPLRFATYNVCKTSCGVGRFSWSNRDDAIIRNIASAKPDILALQEVDNSYEWIAGELERHGYALVDGYLDDCEDGRSCVDDSRLYYRTARVQLMQTLVPSEPISEPCRAFISEDGQLPVAPIEPVTPAQPYRSAFATRAEYVAARTAWDQAYGPIWDAYKDARWLYESTMRDYEDANDDYDCARFVGWKPLSPGGNGDVAFATIGSDKLQDWVQNRNFSWAVFRDKRTRGTVTAVSMHMPNEQTGFAEKYRENLARSLVSYLDERGRELGFGRSPTVLMGDFNSYYQRQPRGVQWIFGRRGFRDAFHARRTVHDDVPTVNLTSQQANPFPARPFHFDAPARLDYVMYDKGQALRYEVHLRLKPNGAFDNRFRGSDHNLVLADLRLPVVKATDGWFAAR